MSSFDVDTFELWADFLTAAATSENPVERIIGILVEFEGHVYNRALSDVAMNFQSRALPGIDLIKKMQLSTRYVSSDIFPPNVIPLHHPKPTR